MKTEPAKFNAVIDDIVERHEKGQPVLVGTISIEKSETLSKLLKSAASSTKCSTPSIMKRKRKSSRRQVSSARSR